MEKIPTVEQFIASVLNGYLVRPTGSPNLIGVGGFLFDILENEESRLDSEITDHYVEDNYAIQDHIAIRPVMFTLKGYVGELNNILPLVGLNVLTNIQSLASLGGIAPTFAAQATQAYTKIEDVAAKANAVINQANNVFDIFSDKSTTATKQQAAYKFFKSLWLSRQLCTVETPFEKFDNMAIMSVTGLQRGETRLVSEFAITFKQIRTVTTVHETQQVPTPVLSGRAQAANSASVSSGQVTGKQVDVNILDVYYAGKN